MAASAALRVRSVRLHSWENSSAAPSHVWSPAEDSPLPVRTIASAAPGKSQWYVTDWISDGGHTPFGESLPLPFHISPSAATPQTAPSAPLTAVGLLLALSVGQLLPERVHGQEDHTHSSRAYSAQPIAQTASPYNDSMLRQIWLRHRGNEAIESHQLHPSKECF